MTNTEKIRVATAPFVGIPLSAKEIQAVTLKAFPDTQLGSILPSDHAGANSKGNVYADQLFTRDGGKYVRLPDAEIVTRPKTGRSRQTMEQALASAQAKLDTGVHADAQ